MKRTSSVHDHMEDEQSSAIKKLRLSSPEPIAMTHEGMWSSAPTITNKDTNKSTSMRESKVDLSLFLINYSLMSNKTFKGLLNDWLRKKKWTNEESETMAQLLNQDDILTYLRRVTDIKHRIIYSQKREEQLSFYQTFNPTPDAAHRTTLHHLFQESSLSLLNDQDQLHIGTKRRKYKKTIEKFQRNLDEAMKKNASLVTDMALFQPVIDDLIQHHQHGLDMELKRRRMLLYSDIENCKLLRQFLALNPKKEVVGIWTF